MPTRHNTLDALRRQCGEHRAAVDATCGEGLQVALDAGAPARIGSGDRQNVAGRVGHDALTVEVRRPGRRWCAASCTIDFRRSAARYGSSAPPIAETTAIPSTPVSITAAALSVDTPPIA